MPTKDELAEVMASGDLQKKVEVLSKAVVAITTQKKHLEEEHLRVLNEMARTQDELTTTKEENAALRKQLSALERELHAAASSPTDGGAAPYFGQQVLKGLSSIVGVTDSAGALTTSGGQSTGGPAASSFPSLAPEDVEKIVSGNEQLLRRVYETETKLEVSTTSHKREMARRTEEIKKLQKELTELHSLLETTTSACDGLNALTKQQKAMLHVYEGLFKLSLTRVLVGEEVRDHQYPSSFVASLMGNTPSSTATAQEVKSSFQNASLRLSLTLPRQNLSLGIMLPDVKHTLVDLVLEQHRSGLLRLMGTMTLWVATLKKLLPSSANRSISFAQSADPSAVSLTSGHLHALMERLEDLQELHSAKKQKVKALWEQLSAMLSPTIGTDNRTTSTSTSTPVAEPTARQSDASSPLLGGGSHAGGGNGRCDAISSSSSSAARGMDGCPPPPHPSERAGRSSAEGSPTTLCSSSPLSRSAAQPATELPRHHASKQEECCRLVMELLVTVSDWMELIRLYLPLLQTCSDALVTVTPGAGALSHTSTSSSAAAAAAAGTGWRSSRPPTPEPAAGQASGGAHSAKPSTMPSERRHHHSHPPLKTPQGAHSASSSSNARASLAGNAGVMAFEPAAATVIGAAEGVLRSMHQIVQAILLDYLQETSSETMREGAERASGNSETTTEPTSLLSRLPGAPDTLFTVLFLMWSSLYNFGVLAEPLNELSEALQSRAMHCDSSHLRNVFHLLRDDFQQMHQHLAGAAFGLRRPTTTHGGRGDRPKADSEVVVETLNRLSASWFDNETPPFATLGAAPGAGWQRSDIPSLPMRHSPAGAPSSWDAIALLRDDAAGIRNAEEVIEVLIRMLEEADETAMDQHHQLRGALFEVAELRDAFAFQKSQFFQMERSHRETLGKMKDEREVLLEQIELLSNQLARSTGGQ